MGVSEILEQSTAAAEAFAADCIAMDKAWYDGKFDEWLASKREETLQNARGGANHSDDTAGQV